MKSPLFFIPVLMLSLFGFEHARAQVDFRKFPIDSFKLPDIDRSALSFSGSIFGGYSNVNHPDLNERDLNSDFRPRVGLTYSRYINRTDLQADILVNTTQNLSVSHDENFFLAPPEGENRTDFNSASHAFGNWRKYKDASFHQMGGSISYSNFYNSRSTNSRVDNSFNTDFSGTIGFGKGRIETISDVAMAMFILKDAMDLGLDGSTFTTENIYDFASLMAEVRNERIFDFRRMRVQELRELYNFMLDQDWVIPNDPGYFTVLTDNWIYNTRFFRTSGKRWIYSLNPEVHYTADHEQSDVAPVSNQKQLDIGANIVANFNRSKPKSLYKDNIRVHEASFGFFNRQEYFDTLNQPSNFLNFNFENSIGKRWYPNNRTNISCTLNADYSYYRFIDLPTEFTKEDQHLLNTGLGAQCDYFISYKTQLIANASLQYAYSSGGVFFAPFFNLFSTNGKTSGFNASLSASLVVSIF